VKDRKMCLGDRSFRVTCCVDQLPSFSRWRSRSRRSLNIVEEEGGGTIALTALKQVQVDSSTQLVDWLIFGYFC